MRLVYATTSNRKYRSFLRDARQSDFEIEQWNVEMPEDRSGDAELVARGKVRYAFARVNSQVFALDAGFYIDSLNGFPRTFVNFALDTISLEGILRLAEGKPRTCKFIEALAYLDSCLSEPKTFVTHINGNLAESIRGEQQEYHWSRLATVFMPGHSSNTLGEMTEQEYLSWKIVNRPEGSAIAQFLKWFQTHRQKYSTILCEHLT